jgi:hypothetical protein
MKAEIMTIAAKIFSCFVGIGLSFKWFKNGLMK